MSASDLAEVLDRIADVSPHVDVPDDPIEQAELLEAAVRLKADNDRLIARLRAALSGNIPCDDPPDLDGLCMRCGRRRAPAVAEHKTGCLFAPVLTFARLARRLAVRRFRHGRATMRFLQGSRS